MPPHRTLGEQIKADRKRAGMTQAALLARIKQCGQTAIAVKDGDDQLSFYEGWVAKLETNTLRRRPPDRVYELLATALDADVNLYRQLPMTRSLLHNARQDHGQVVMTLEAMALLIDELSPCSQLYIEGAPGRCLAAEYPEFLAAVLLAVVRSEIDVFLLANEDPDGEIDAPLTLRSLVLATVTLSIIENSMEIDAGQNAPSQQAILSAARQAFVVADRGGRIPKGLSEHAQHPFNVTPKVRDVVMHRFTVFASESPRMTPERYPPFHFIMGKDCNPLARRPVQAYWADDLRCAIPDRDPQSAERYVRAKCESQGVDLLELTPELLASRAKKIGMEIRLP